MERNREAANDATEEGTHDGVVGVCKDGSDQELDDELLVERSVRETRCTGENRATWQCR